MIDAVSSLVLNTPYLRGSTEQVAAARSYAANPDRVQETPKAPYISPYISVNVYYDKAVLQIRDSETGDVLSQFPAENQLEQARLQAARDQETPEVSTPQQSPESSSQTSSGDARSDEPVTPDSVSTTSKKSAPPTPQQIDAFSAGAQTAAPSASTVSVEA